ncbi:MAG TPA: hypothetical protein VFN30_01580 [Chitinophagaceae bacterium]|nr:hypothetical protein [Chitinophagaceae bacterium]
MKKILVILSIFSVVTAYTQTQETIDSVTNQICKSISNSTIEPDSIKIETAFKKYFPPLIQAIDSSKTEAVITEIILRLQITCYKFWKFIDNTTPKNQYWKTIDSFSVSVCSKKDCDELFLKSNLYYYEPTGDKTKLKLSKDYWVDSLSDGSFSKLKLVRTTQCDFEIEFIESNHPIKQKLSRAADKYYYRIISKEEHYYIMQVNLPLANKYSEFRIYFQSK